MTTQGTLGPFMTLILTLTAKGKHAANNLSQAEVVNSLLFARLLTEILRKKPAGYANSTGRVFRIGSSPECRINS